MDPNTRKNLGQLWILTQGKSFDSYGSVTEETQKVSASHQWPGSDVLLGFKGFHSETCC